MPTRADVLAELARRGVSIDGLAQGGPDVKLTEDQGKSQGYGKLMATAEDQYLRARQAGYNPSSVRNALAESVEDFKLPFVGKPFSGVGALIRDDASDQGKAAERAWLDSQLKAMTGAGQSTSETIENPRTYFPLQGEGGATYRNKYDMRAAAYDAIKRRAGPAGADLPKQYPNPATMAPKPAAARPRPPQRGQVVDGYRYNGGNPADPKSWAKQ